jgi:hypothetical protein
MKLLFFAFVIVMSFMRAYHYKQSRQAKIDTPEKVKSVNPETNDLPVEEQ